MISKLCVFVSLPLVGGSAVATLFGISVLKVCWRKSEQMRGALFILEIKFP